jgi:hypothetical protein
MVRYVICVNTTTADMKSEVHTAVLLKIQVLQRCDTVTGPEVPMFQKTVVLQDQAKTQ